jgi:hypothetical protein
MWESKQLPEALKGEDGNIIKDKITGKVINTGRKIEYTDYTFRDLKGEVIKIMALGDKYRDLENKAVIVTLDLTRKEFGGKAEWKASIKNMVEA